MRMLGDTIIEIEDPRTQTWFMRTPGGINLANEDPRGHKQGL